MQFFGFEFIESATREDNEIDRGKPVLIEAKGFANDTSNTVAFHGSTHIFFGDDKPDSGMIEFVEAGKNQDGLIRYFQGDLIKDAFKTLASQDSELTRVVESGHPLLPDQKRECIKHSDACGL